jgi:hypothetical protein
MTLPLKASWNEQQLKWSSQKMISQLIITPGEHFSKCGDQMKLKTMSVPESLPHGQRQKMVMKKLLPKFGTFTIILIWTNVIVSYNIQWYPYNLSSPTREKNKGQREPAPTIQPCSMDGLWTENTTSFYSCPKANLTIVVNYVLTINHPHASTYLVPIKCFTYMH